MIERITAAALAALFCLAPSSGPAADPAAEASGSRAAAGEEAGFSKRMVRLARRDHNVLRSGPGDGFSIVAVHGKGNSFEVVALRDGWYNVRLTDTRTGWIHGSLCEEFDDLSGLELRPNPRLYSRIGSFVLTGYAGGYAFDRKSNSLTLGGRLGYYLFDFLEIEGALGWTHVDRPQEIVESLFHLRLESEEFHMIHYSMNALVELLPGRRVVPFVTGGVGSGVMKGRTEPTVNLGAGTLLFINKTAGMRWEIRGFRMRSGPGGARRTDRNVEFTLGTSLHF